MKTAFLTSGWGLPLTVGVALHVGLAFIPVAFSQGSNTQPQPIRIALISAPEPPPAVAPPEPTVVPEVMPTVELPPEVAAKQKPQPQKTKAVVSPSEPLANESAFAAAEVASEVTAPEVQAKPAERPVEEAAVPEVANHTPPPAPVKKFDMHGYGMGIFSAVKAEQQYPRAAARFRLEGTAQIRIRVNRDGSLADRPQIVTSTTHDLLDREALRMIEVAAPFAPLPDGFPQQTKEFVIPIKFQLSRS